MKKHVFHAGSARIGVPKEARVFALYSSGKGFPTLDELNHHCKPVQLGTRVFIGDNCTIYEGAEVGDDCVLEDQSRIGFDTKIGPRGRVMYAAYICDRVQIGEDCRIAGFVCDAAIIEDGCTVMGQLSHKYTASDMQWGAVDEPSPRIEKGSIIGLGAQIVGGIVVGAGSFVAAGSVLTKSIPPNSVVKGINEIIKSDDWPGEELSGFFIRRGAHDNR